MRIFLFCFFLFLLLLIFFGEFSRVIATGLGQLLLDVGDIVSAGFCIFPVFKLCFCISQKKCISRYSNRLGPTVAESGGFCCRRLLFHSRPPGGEDSWPSRRLRNTFRNTVQKYIQKYGWEIQLRNKTDVDFSAAGW